jgi:aminocarboxymuconate-semialdehyde decarboxylase
MATAIDIHTHIVPFELPDCPAAASATRWPQMQPGADCHHRNVVIAGKIFRTVSDDCWDVSRRLSAMDAAGITTQVLSPMPELLSYWIDTRDALVLGRAVNDAIGAIVEQAPGRFIGLGMVPMQDPELAAREVEALMRDERFRGVEIGTNVNGISIADPRFAPVFAAAEATGAAIFVHALHPGGDNHLIGSPALKAVVAFPCETALAIAGLMTSGTLSRFPRLKIAFSHGGGAFGLILPRLLHGWKVLASVGKAMTESPAEIARRLYYDSLVYDATTLDFLVRVFGERQIMIGTDYPFDIFERDPIGVVRATGLPDATLERLTGGNARQFLRLPH